MKKKYNNIILILASLISMHLYAQTDTKFWFVIPDINQHGACGFGGGEPMYLRFTASELPSTVIITQPANALFVHIILNVPANSTVSTSDLSSLKASLRNVNLAGDNPNNLGLYISATSPVSCYYEVGNCTSSDLFSLKGKAALGNEFYIPGPSADGVMSFRNLGIWSFPNYTYKRSFDIVASEDNTVVQITPSCAINLLHPANVTFSVNLNKGQTYSCWASDYTDYNKNFGTGSHVTSNKPIAITRTDDAQVITNNTGFYADMNGDQIVPVDYIGSSYIINKGALHVNNGGFDLAYVTATQANTIITLTGATFTAGGASITLQAGQSAEVQVSSNYATAKSTNKPFYLYHVTGISGEDAAALIPPVDVCSGTNKVGFYRTDLGVANQVFKLNIIIRANAANPDPNDNFQFFVNGSLNAGLTTQINTAAFTQLPNNTDWKVATIDLSSTKTVGQTFMLTNSSARFLMGLINGSAGNTTRYGYFAGFGDAETRAYVVSADSSYAVVCTNQSVRLAASGGVSYTWSSTDFSIPPSQVNLQNPLIQPTTAGTFHFKVTINGVCDNLSETKDVTIKVDPRPATPIVSDVEACLNDPVTPFSISNAGTNTYFEWFTDTILDPVARINTSTYNTGKTATGNYSYFVKQAVNNNSCFSYPKKTTLSISAEPKPTLVLNQKIFSVCAPQTVNLAAAIDLVNSVNLATVYTKLATTGWTGKVEKNTTISAINASDLNNILDANAGTSYYVDYTLSSKPTIILDMTQIRTFGRIEINSLLDGDPNIGNYPKTYSISGSNDPNAFTTTTASWTLIKTETGALNKTIDLPVVQSYRYIKISSSTDGFFTTNRWAPHTIAIYNRNGSIVSYYSDRACTNPVINYTNVSTPGWYYLKAGSGQCSTIDSVQITGGVKPAVPVFSAGPTSVCAGQSAVVYTVVNDPAASNYRWRYTGTNVTINNGTKNSITINFAANATAGTLWAVAENSCGKDSISRAISFISPSNGGTLNTDNLTDKKTICSGSSSILNLTGNTGTVQKWQSSTDGTNWTDLYTDALTTHSSGNITQTRSYRVLVQNSTCPAATSTIATLNVEALPSITNIAKTDVTGCGLSDGTITVTATPANVQYSLDSSIWQPSNTFNNLAKNAYNVWVKNTAGIGCSIKSSSLTTINDAQSPTITNISSTNISDCGLTDGTITVTATGGIGTYQYSKDGGSTWTNTTGSFTNLDAGSYPIWVRFSNQTCPVDGGIKIITSPIAPTPGTVDVTNETNCGAKDGTITINATGGLGSFLYSIDNGTTFSATNAITGLSAGNYVIKIKNSDGTCEVLGSSENITAPGSPSIDSVVVTNISNCNLVIKDGTIKVYASGGSIPGSYKYSLDANPAVATSIFSNLSAKNYEVKVSNPDGSCTATYNGAIVNEPSVPVISNIETTNISDCGLIDGTITIIASGNTGPLEYSIGNNSWQTGNIFSALDSGTYSVSVRYSKDAICLTNYATPQKIQKPFIPEITTIFEQDRTSCSSNNGIITITANKSSSLGTLQYSVSNTSTWSNTNTFAALDSGSYQVSVKYNEYSNACIKNLDSIVHLVLICTDTITINLCNTVGVYNLFNAFNPPLIDSSGIIKNPSNQVISSNLIDVSNFVEGVYPYSYYRTQYYRNLILINLSTQKQSGTSVLQPVYCDKNINLFESLVDGTYDAANPGTNNYTYFHKENNECIAKSTSATILIDSIIPQITCAEEIRQFLEFENTYYVASDSLNPLTISDNCGFYSLSNNINNNSSITGAHIEKSSVLAWTVTDAAGNSATCETKISIVKGMLPNTISPNGDGYNDVWEFKLNQYFPNAQVEIYNRWGVKIWESDKGYDTNGNFWDGRDLNNQKVPVDSYQYIIIEGAKLIRKGFIAVIY